VHTRASVYVCERPINKLGSNSSKDNLSHDEHVANVEYEPQYASIFNRRCQSVGHIEIRFKESRMSQTTESAVEHIDGTLKHIATSCKLHVLK